ncbi:hypothetical protein GCM10022381_01440 [Leifsonia kafniensis]|uniref:TrwC relaxase domain-containing protein n=1 Tax=Leifsonia kafniensis TaxID=475957 RepID=A0ABP7K170_9MICO
MPEEIVAVFSSRSRRIDIQAHRLVEEWAAGHGRQPSNATIIRLRQQARLTTRPEKEVRSLADLTAGWRERASNLLGQDATQWARTVTNNDPASLRRVPGGQAPNGTGELVTARVFLPYGAGRAAGEAGSSGLRALRDGLSGAHTYRALGLSRRVDARPVTEVLAHPVSEALRDAVTEVTREVANKKLP